ncbi:MAG: hypothetical protein U1B83_00060, partial [Candidatus Cloacimonadaceae bacterium]|nr:hypothetical protein [Candidatus Cloacimonadaceae bacterium]
MKHCFLLLAAMLMIQFAVAQALDIDRLWMDHTYVRGTDCQIRNGLLYVTNDRIADQSAPGLDLIIFDLSDPQRIAALSYLDLDAPPSIALALCASRAVVIHDNGLLSTIDTTDPVLPVFVAAVQNPASIVAHQVLGSYLYVYDNDGYLRCYSMIGLDLLASLWIGSGYESMAFCGTRAYLSSTAPDFRCLNITKPTAPTDLGTIGNAVGLQITASYNDTLICKDTYGSVVRFYDVSSPSTALLVLTWTPNMQVGLMRMDADAGNLVIYTEGYLSDYY